MQRARSKLFSQQESKRENGAYSTVSTAHGGAERKFSHKPPLPQQHIKMMDGEEVQVRKNQIA